MNRLILSALLSATLLACGSEADHPLGGPHGSESTGTDPTAGTSGSGAPSGTDDSTVDGGTPATSGNPDPGTTLPDGGKTPGTPPGTPPMTGAAPTWSYLVTTYFASGTIGHCGTGCHHHGSTFDTPGAAYTYMKGQGYISGTSSPLIDNAQSCLSWFGGGSMPPSGPTTSAAATADFKAWVAAGALNN